MTIRISPTPWRYVPEHKLVEDANKRVVMYVSAPIGPGDSIEQIIALPERADMHGRLAAAAPDLEAALRELMSAVIRRLPPAYKNALEPELTGAHSALCKAKKG